MSGLRFRLLPAALLLLLMVTSAFGHEVTFDTSAAKAVVDAVANAELTAEQARKIAQLPANQKVLQKVKSAFADATEDRFVEELLATAKGTKFEGASMFRFERTRRDRAAILQTLEAYERDPAAFLKWVADRVEMFSPPGSSLALKGHFVAAGSPTGFTLGGNDFYLNVSHFPNDLEGARVIAAHELYHAVEGSAVAKSPDPQVRRFNREVLQSFDTEDARHRYIVDRFLGRLITEGIAMYVGDPELLANATGSYSKWEVGRLRATQGRMDRLPILLDVSLIALTAPQPVDFSDAYALGFYGDDQPLYFLGYEMSKQIALKKGTRRLGELVTGSGCAFALDYLAVADDKSPKLRDRTKAMIGTYCAKKDDVRVTITH